MVATVGLLYAVAALTSEPLVNLVNSTQKVTPDNVQFQLTLTAGAADKHGNPRNLPVTLLCRNREWSATGGTVSKARFDGKRLAGTLVVASNEYAFSARVTATPSDTIANDRGPNGENLQFWKTFAEGQGVAGHVEGVWHAGTTTNRLAGTMHLAVRPGRWNMGKFDHGLNLLFDLGRRRENWNHARIAQYEFAVPRDLRRFTGLRVRLATDLPRDDVNISLWLRESDGSWYYLKNAVPLVERQNEAVLLFDDFAEAEWVAPENHMDEDYTLDLESISHVGIGIVNPLGVGRVSFTVQAIDLVRGTRPSRPPAQLEVTGKFLSVNGHDAVPAGIFGGFAGHLPAQFRPGCQRNLPLVGSPYAPRQRFVQFRDGDILDETAVTAGLGAYSNLLANAKLPDRRGPSRQLPLLDRLNFLLKQPELDSAPARNGTEIMERNRRVLEAAFPNCFRPLPAAPPTEEFIIECFGDRYQPPPLLTGAGWREGLQHFGASLAQRAKEDGYAVHLEFWNEPYLNWAERSRVALKSDFYNTASATNGGPVSVRYRAGKDGSADGPVIPHFRWVGNGTGGWKVVDETAFTYWAGRGLGWVYDQMLGAVGSVVKSNNPAVQVIGGWGFRWHEDHWAGWDMLYQPTIDRNIGWLDGVNEHHYQGDTTAMNGSYEVLIAYGVTRHKKWLHVYNTECNDLVDTPARGPVDTPEKAKAASKYRKMTYNLRDCLYSLAQSPDKLRSRTVIHNDAGSSNSWTEVAYGLMRDIRGRLVQTVSDDPNIWCVASVDPVTTALVVAVFNDYRQPRTFNLNLTAPAGATFTNAIVEQPRADMATFELRLDHTELPATSNLSVTLPARSAWKISLPLLGTVPARVDVARTQFFSPDILQRVARGTNFTTTVRLDELALRCARRAWLRLVVEDITEGEAIVKVAGQGFALPKALTADNVNRIIELPLDVAGLPGTVPVTFRVASGNHAGYRVDMTSIVLEHPPLEQPAKRVAGHEMSLGTSGGRVGQSGKLTVTGPLLGRSRGQGGTQPGAVSFISQGVGRFGGDRFLEFPAFGLGKDLGLRGGEFPALLLPGEDERDADVAVAVVGGFGLGEDDDAPRACEGQLGFVGELDDNAGGGGAGFEVLPLQPKVEVLDKAGETLPQFGLGIPPATNQGGKC